MSPDRNGDVDETRIPLLVVLGPTGSGKSALGLEIADRLAGEIVSADAFAVYRGLDIGTDKPTAEERRRIPHHMIDIADPRHRYSAGEFAAGAARSIADILARRRVPLVVGGTNFWVRALLLGLFPEPKRDPAVTRRLESEWSHDSASVYDRLREVDPIAADRIGPRDRQRLLRALEVFELSGEAMSSHWSRHRPHDRYRPLIVAPQRDRETLYAKIDARVDNMFANGLVEEVTRILASGVPSSAHALKAIGYREVVEFLEGKCDVNTAAERTKQSSRKLAKRQLTWLRNLREGTLNWVLPAEKDGTATIIDLWIHHIEERQR